MASTIQLGAFPTPLQGVLVTGEEIKQGLNKPYLSARSALIKSIALEVLKLLAAIGLCCFSVVFVLPLNPLAGIILTVGTALLAIGSSASLILSIQELIRLKGVVNDAQKSFEDRPQHCVN